MKKSRFSIGYKLKSLIFLLPFFSGYANARFDSETLQAPIDRVTDLRERFLAASDQYQTDEQAKQPFYIHNDKINEQIDIVWNNYWNNWNNWANWANWGNWGNWANY